MRSCVHREFCSCVHREYTHLLLIRYISKSMRLPEQHSTALCHPHSLLLYICALVLLRVTQSPTYPTSAVCSVCHGLMLLRSLLLSYTDSLINLRRHHQLSVSEHRRPGLIWCLDPIILSLSHHRVSPSLSHLSTLALSALQVTVTRSLSLTSSR